MECRGKSCVVKYKNIPRFLSGKNKIVCIPGNLCKIVQQTWNLIMNQEDLKITENQRKIGQGGNIRCHGVRMGWREI